VVQEEIPSVENDYPLLRDKGIMNPLKIDIFNQIIKNNSVFMHLNPRLANVDIPFKLRFQDQVVLQVGHNMSVPIPDLLVDEIGVCCTLSFKGTPYTCTIPWYSIFALVGDDDRGWVWEDEMPANIRSSAKDFAKPALQTIQGGRGNKPKSLKRPNLRLVK